jgi:hypothetical protein
MRRKGRERVFTIFIALVLVIILVSSIIAVNGTIQMHGFILKDLGGIHVC